MAGRIAAAAHGGLRSAKRTCTGSCLGEGGFYREGGLAALELAKARDQLALYVT